MFAQDQLDGKELEIKQALRKVNMYGRTGQKPFVIRAKYDM